MGRKNFTLEAFIQHGLAETRDGREARFVRIEPETEEYFVIASIGGEDLTFAPHGNFYKTESNGRDLIYVITKETEMELKDEHKKIISKASVEIGFDKGSKCYLTAKFVIEAMVALADRPRVEFTDEHIKAALKSVYGFENFLSNDIQAARAVLAAYDARPYVSEDEPINLEKLATGEYVLLYDGKQSDIVSIDVLIHYPGKYTMRRKS